MRRWFASAALALSALALSVLAQPAAAQEIRIDVPVAVKQAKVVFNLDHFAFEGDQPTGLEFMRILLAYFREQGTQVRMVAIFHGAAGYMLLDDAAYGRVRNWSAGNPYKGQIAELMKAGVEIEECAETMRLNRWGNADLLPGVKVNTGANMRIIQLVQDGFVQLQP